MGQQDPTSGTSLVDRVRRLPNRPAEGQALWLLEDGRRLVRSDTARARRRFREAVQIGKSGDAAGWASLELVRLDLRTVRHPQELSPLIQTLRAGAERHRTAATDLTRLANTATAVRTAIASVTPGSPEGDLRLFLAGEAARDSLLAPRLADALFRRIIRQWPESPYAPKAALAAQQVNPEWADSGRALLEARYFQSPYLAMIRGEESQGYRQLEDSLGAFASAQAETEARTPVAKPGRPAPVQGDNKPTPQRPRPAPNKPIFEP
jgi:hypothetical protein